MTELSTEQQELLQKHKNRNAVKLFFRCSAWVIGLTALIVGFAYTHLFDPNQEIARNFADAIMILLFVADLIAFPFFLVAMMLVMVAGTKMTKPKDRHLVMMTGYGISPFDHSLRFHVFLVLNLMISVVLIAVGGWWMVMGIIYFVTNTIQKVLEAKVSRIVRNYVLCLKPEDIKELEAEPKPKEEEKKEPSPFSSN
jgi:hypothetical protein